MADFFPPGFWKTTVLVISVILCVVGLDVLIGSRLMHALGRVANKCIRIDEVVIKLLAMFKKNSDQEFNVENVLLSGPGRLLTCSLAFGCAYLMVFVLFPRLS